MVWQSTVKDDNAKVHKVRMINHERFNVSQVYNQYYREQKQLVGRQQDLENLVRIWLSPTIIISRFVKRQAQRSGRKSL